ncbi:methylcobalamin:coenzyme M methyltransferase [Bacteroidales bacterium Barb6]|nr:methylcobalamin:coenzyme M methyltransferase [Bacteroidales bacterium Barb6]
MKKRDFLKSGLYAAGGLGLVSSNAVLAACGQKAPAGGAAAPVYLHGGKVNKREKVLAVLDQSKPNEYVPAAFFMHFKEKLGQGAINRHLEYFRATNMDFAKIQYEIVLPRLTNINRPEDWEKIPVYDKEFFAPQLEVIGALAKELKSEALILPTVYSPFSLAGQLMGEGFITHARENPDAVAKGFAHITESILNYIREAVNLGADGFYISSQGGEAANFGESPLFDQLTVPFDTAILQESSDKALLNILHICDYGNTYNRLDKFISYPGSIINPPIRLADGSDVKTKDVQERFRRPVLGGLDRLGVISTGSPEEIKKDVDKVLAEAAPNFILGADCTISGETSWQTIRSVIDYAHDWRSTHA